MAVFAVVLATGIAPTPSQAAAAPDPSAGKIKLDAKPTPAQAAAIRRAATDDLADCDHPASECYSMGLADLNDDGRPDLIVQYSSAAGFCGSTGCSGVIVMATPQGYAAKPIGLPNFGWATVQPGKHHGMHDLQYNGDSPIWKWNGKAYDVDKADLPGANAPPWQTRHTAAGTLAMVAVTESIIKTVSVFCSQGKPLLAILLKQRPGTGPLTLTFVFRGATVNVPMSQANRDATLWMADLSGSDLPQWLAHRGNTSVTRELARLADRAYLRINAVMQGEISLKDSTRTTQAVLGGCYRY